MNKQQEIIDGLLSELRRGTIPLCVLGQLSVPTYGYLLVQNLDEKGLRVEASTLYPLLRRLEKQNLLTSRWETEGAKPRKYYELTSLGREIYEKLCVQWTEIRESMNRLMQIG